MIQMHTRSVTRFFIPLIDVLLLLFSIFLLMPFFGEEQNAGENRVLSTEDLTDSLESLKRELDAKNQELEKFDTVREPYRELDKMKAELERLRKEKERELQRPTFVRVIDIDPKSGALSFFDPASLDEAKVVIPDEQAAARLIARHQKEAGERRLYYYFLRPRVDSGYPTQAQELEYKRWFAKAANSLKEKLP